MYILFYFFLGLYFSLTIENADGNEEYICSPSCDTNRPNFDEDKICIDGCSSTGKPIIDYNNQCVERCNQNSEYKYILEGKCVDVCSGDKRYILNGECVVKADCNINTYFFYPIKKNLVLTGDKECILNCPNRYFVKTSQPLTRMG